MSQPELDTGVIPKPDEIWTHLSIFGSKVEGLVKIHSQHSSVGVFYVGGYPDGIIQTVSRLDLGKRVTCEMEVLAWTSR